MQDYGAPIGYRIASKHPDAIQSIVVQNENAYREGIGTAFDPMKPFCAKRKSETEKPVRDLLTTDTTIFQYTHGVTDSDRITPDSYTMDQLFLDPPGTAAIQLNLLYNYQSNVALYDRWHECFRRHQPRMLILWGKNDPHIPHLVNPVHDFHDEIQDISRQNSLNSSKSRRSLAQIRTRIDVED